MHVMHAMHVMHVVPEMHVVHVMHDMYDMYDMHHMHVMLWDNLGFLWDRVRTFSRLFVRYYTVVLEPFFDPWEAFGTMLGFTAVIGGWNTYEKYKFWSESEHAFVTKWVGNRFDELSTGGNGSARLKLDPGMDSCCKIKENKKNAMFCLGSRGGVMEGFNWTTASWTGFAFTDLYLPWKSCTASANAPLTRPPNACIRNSRLNG